MARPAVEERIQNAAKWVGRFGTDRDHLLVIGEDGVLLRAAPGFEFLFPSIDGQAPEGQAIDEVFAHAPVRVLDGATTNFCECSFDSWRDDDPVVIQVRRPDGERSYLEARPVAWQADRGDLAREDVLIFRFEDKTAEWKMLARLANSERRFRVVADASLDMVTESDDQGRFLYVSAACEQVLGYTPEELVGTRALDLHHPEDVDAFVESVVTGGRTGEPFRAPAHRLRCRDGRWIWVEAMGIGYRDANNRHRVVGVSRDISAQVEAEAVRRRLSERVLRSQKLESLGAMAGGVAHEFNNLLTPIVGNVGLALLDLPANSPIRKRVEMIKTAAHRATALTRQMLAYAGQGVPSVDAVDVSRSIREMALLLESTATARARIEYDLAEQLPLIEVDTSHVIQVVMNLVVNAAESLRPEGGRITIRTGSLHADEAYLESCFISEDLAKGLYVFLEIEDDGLGIPRSDQQRIFDPFFTTRFAGRGLGLAAVDGIVRGYRGALDLISEVEHGTRIRVLFPTAGVTSRAARPARRAPDAARTDPDAVRGTVLVVDDDANACTFMTDVLERAGFRVLAVQSGAAAVKLFERHIDEIDGVVLDYTMPLVSGAEVFDTLRSLRPDVRVLVVSGYAQGRAVEELMRRGLRSFLQKPFDPSNLVRAVDHLIDEGNAAEAPGPGSG